MNKNDTIYGYHALKSALKTKPEAIKQLYLQTSRQDQRVLEIKDLANQQGIPVSRVTRQELNALLEQEQPHQGMVAQCVERLRYDESDLPSLLSAQEGPILLLILDGVQDPHNLGACMRTANGLGVQAILAPKDKAVGITPVVRKVASGAAETMPFIQVTNLSRTMRWLQKQGIWLVGTAADAKCPLSEVDMTGHTGIVMGGEGQGMRRLTREHCDFLAHIAMQGSVSSLNVSVATGICLYEAQRQRINVSC